MHIQGSDREVCTQPRTGSLQGDTVACSQFLEIYHPVLDKWLEGTQQYELLVDDPVTGTCVDVSLTSYADDVARCFLGENSEELFLHLTHANEILDDKLSVIGLQQNIEKQEHVVFCAGIGSTTFLADVYKDGLLPGKACVTSKYLGSWKHFKGNNFAEIRARRRAAEVGFYAMGSFWAHGPRRQYCVLFDGSQCCSFRFGVLGSVKC